MINLVGSLSYLFYILQGFTYAKTLNFLGLKQSYGFIFGTFLIAHIVYSVNPKNIVLYVLLTFIHRVVLKVSLGIYLNDWTIYYVYDLSRRKRILII